MPVYAGFTPCLGADVCRIFRIVLRGIRLKEALQEFYRIESQILIITVDNGIAAAQEGTGFWAAGDNVVVTHHEPADAPGCSSN